MKEESNKILDKKNLLLTICGFSEYLISVKHKLLRTMTDGNVCNALNETLSLQKCFISDATSTMMNVESL